MVTDECAIAMEALANPPLDTAAVQHDEYEDGATTTVSSSQGYNEGETKTYNLKIELASCMSKCKTHSDTLPPQRCVLVGRLYISFDSLN